MTTEPVKAISNLFYEYTPGNGAMIGIKGQTVIDPLRRKVFRSDGVTPGGVEVEPEFHRITNYQMGHVVPVSVIRSKVLSYFNLLKDDIDHMHRSRDPFLKQLQLYVSGQYPNLIRFLNDEVIDVDGKIHWNYLELVEMAGFEIWYNHEIRFFQMRLHGITVTMK